MANGRALVSPPAFVPASFGLLSVAQDRTGEFPAHWGAGITWQPLCGAGDTTYDECLVVTGAGAIPEPPAKSATFVSNRFAATPFTVYVRKDCSIPTYFDAASGEVREAITASEAYDVEAAFWTGNAGDREVVHPHLAADTELISDRDILQLEADEASSDALDIVQGFGLLQKSTMDCMRGQVTFHVTPDVAAALIAWNQIRLVGNHYEDLLGNLVAIGAGYTGSGPDGTAATAASTWIYGTGPVFYARGPLLSPTPRESVVLNENTLEQMAERTYVIGYSCCLVAVEIDLTLTICCSGA